MWLVTDMRRGESLFQLDPNASLLVDEGIEADGSNLSGVTANCAWSENCKKKKPKFLVIFLIFLKHVTNLKF